SLDLHGNVTSRMVEQADVLVAFRTYPHVDMAETGRRTAVQLEKLMARGRPFAKAFRRLPFLIPIPWQCTSLEPARSIYQRVAELETGEVSSTSFLMGFPAADVEECAPTVLAYGETQEAADKAANEMMELVLANEMAFKGRAYDPDEGVQLA